jgi:4'-phosphopantetheinyl transferase
LAQTGEFVVSEVLVITGEAGLENAVAVETSGHKWAAPYQPLQLKDDEVHLWRVDRMHRRHPPRGLWETLAPPELHKVGQFRSKADSTRYTTVRGALRHVLARYLGRSPRELVFRYGAHGKPELADGAIRFNVSHSGDLALLAVSATSDVGIDVEHIGAGAEKEDVEWIFPAQTLRSLMELPQPARELAFLQGWTRMEAYSKARGEGLPSNLETFDQFLWPCAIGNHLRREKDRERNGWWFHDFSPRRGYIAALTARGRGRHVRYWKWPGPEGSRDWPVSGR